MSDIILEIRDRLFNLKEEDYKNFQTKLIPNIDSNSVVGVKTKPLKDIAKELKNRDDIDLFLNDLPHKYFEENQIHAFIISEIKDFDRCISYLEIFLDYIDNWATCDQTNPKIFKKKKFELQEYIDRWIESNETYRIRFGIRMLMNHFLDDDFEMTYPNKVASVRSEEYYVNMMIAWYFATALAKKYDEVITFLEDKKLDVWVHNKTIQKAVESFRVEDWQKEYLKTLRIK